MRVDIHVHTGKYSGCAVSTPEKMVESAIASGLDGIVLTEHDLFWPSRQLDELQRKYPRIKLFSGVEMTSLEGEHILVMGIEEKELLPLLPVLELIEAVHRRGGIAILAHPWRWGVEPTPGVLDLVDALEVASTNVTPIMEGKIKSILENTPIPGVSGSDSHSWETLGLFAIDLEVEAATELELADLIRCGRFANFADWEGARQLKQDFYKGWKRIPIED